MIHFPNLFPLQNIYKQAVHNYVVNFFIQAKWAHNYLCHSFLVCICKVNAHSNEYRHPSQRLHRSSPIAPLSEHQKTQDALRTDEPSPSIPLFKHWKRQHNQRKAGYTFTPLLQVLGIPSIILFYHLQAG